MVKIIKDIDEWRLIHKDIEQQGKTLGFVPTMGALHIGHRSLIEQSVKENDVTICSIFVNPTQFNDKNDLNNYPITIEDDKNLLESAGCDYIFLPNKKMIYPDNYRYIVKEGKYSKELCGAHREGHFDGVLTVVLKLLNIIDSDKAYFGEKDWQQFKLIHDMAEALFLKTKIVPCKLIREKDGLAFSSRNKLLTSKNRKIAPELYKVISGKGDIQGMKEELGNLGFIVDYIEIKEDRVLAAATLGNVRLIDNVKR